MTARQGPEIDGEQRWHALRSEEALAAFTAMQPDEKGPRRAYALYHQGRILGLLGKTAEATDAFKKAKELSGEGPLADQIDERLASLGS